MTIDFHCHIGQSLDGTIQTISQLKRNMKKYGIKKSVVFSFDEKNKTVEEQSLNLLDISKKEKKIMPFLRFDPKKMQPSVLRTLLNKKFYGIKLHPRSENFDPSDRKLFPIFREIAKSGKPLLLHVKKYHLKHTDPMLAASLARKLPSLKLVIAHFVSVQPLVFDYVKKHKLKNVYFDTSITGYKGYIERMGKKIGFNKILFGSDCPYSDQEVELLKIKKLSISKENKQKILERNAKGLLRL